MKERGKDIVRDKRGRGRKGGGRERSTVCVRAGREGREVH